DQKRKTYEAGEIIFREHEEGDFAYFIESGNVELSASNQGKKIVLTSVGPGELLGEMAIIDKFTRTATATALEKTVAIPIDSKAVQKKITSSDPMTHMLLRVVVERFRWALRRVLDSERLYTDGTLTLGAIDTKYEKARDYAINRIKLEQDLKEALDDEQFSLHYQPIVDAKSGVIAGFEALIRWEHPEQGLVSPADFIPAAEDTGLILPIGKWVLEQACRDLPRFQKVFARSLPDMAPLFMSVNVSPRQIEDLAEAGALVAALKTSGIHPSRIKLEITEELLIHSPELAKHALNNIKNAGVDLAIDDFGTGYSSLSYLHSFPLDVLKIDRAFVNSMTKDKKSMQIVEAIVGLSRALGLKVVAEGIEDAGTLKIIRKLGCDYFQGYFASRPLPVDKMIQSLERHSKSRATTTAKQA
ncbi:MAG: EAL domain-containing protein, partial [Gammaproteobacteria bacterium]|nr:EAL domain-containing protein [Gammaproteobacteria bacterium]